MERAVGADDDVAAAPTELAGELDGALVRLRARVAEEHEPVARIDQTVERGGDILAGLGAEEVRDVQQRARLRVDRVGDDGIRMSERCDREPAEEVEVVVAVGVPQIGCRSPRTNVTGCGG